MPGNAPPLSSRTPSPDPSYDPTNSNLQPNNRAPTFRRQPTGQGNQNTASGAGSQNVQQPPVFTHGSTSVPQHLFGPIWAGPQPQPQVMQQPTGIFNKRSQAALDNSPGSQILTTDVTGQSVKRSRQTQPQGHQPAPQAQLNAAQPTHRTRQEMINLANAIQTRGPMRDDSLPLPGFNQGASSGKNSHAVREAKRDDFTALVLENPRLNAEDLVKKMQGRYPGTLRKTVNELSMPLKQAWAFGVPTSVVDNMRRVASNPAYDRFIEDSLTKDTGQRGRILNTGPFASWQQLENRWENRPAPRTRPEIMEYLRPLARTPENAAIFASMALPDDYVCDLPEALDLWRQYDAGTLNPQSLGPRATPLLHPDVAAAQAATRQQAPGDNYLDNVSLISSASSSPQGTLPPAVNYGVQNLPGLNANSQGDSILAQVAQAQQQRRLTDPRSDGPNNLTQTRLHQPSATSTSTISSGQPQNPLAPGANFGGGLLPAHQLLNSSDADVFNYLEAVLPPANPGQMQRRKAGNPEYFQPSIPNYPQQSATNDVASPVHMQLVLAGNPEYSQPSNPTYPQQPATNYAANPGGMSNPNSYVQNQAQLGAAQNTSFSSDPTSAINLRNSQQMFEQRRAAQQTQALNNPPLDQPHVQQMQPTVQQHLQPPNPTSDPYTNTGVNLSGAFNSMQLQGVNQPPVYPQNQQQPVQQRQVPGLNYPSANQTGGQMPPPYPLQNPPPNQPVNWTPQIPNLQNLQVGQPLFGQTNTVQNLRPLPAGHAPLSLSPVNLNYVDTFGSPPPNSSEMDVYFPRGPGGASGAN